MSIKKLLLGRNFYKILIKIATPIILQSFIINSLNFIDVMMIGQLGNSAVASVGLGNQFTVFFVLLAFGVASGTGIFTAQFWGRRYIKNIKKTLTIGLKIGWLFAILFTLLAIAIPEELMGLMSDDKTVVHDGAEYVQIVGLCYLPFSFSVIYSAVLRSMKLTFIPLLGSLIALSINTFLNYAMIFGNFGFPELGIKGAAYATLISRVVEFLVIFGLSYWRKLPCHVYVLDFKFLDKKLLREYAKTVAPVIFTSGMWILGVNFYAGIIAHISTDAISAYSVSETVEKLAMIFFISLGQACSVMVGNTLGKGDYSLAKEYSKRFLLLNFIASIVLCGVIISIRPAVLSLYNLSVESLYNANLIMLVISIGMWFKSANIIFNIGLFRTSGDTKYSMMLDVGGPWLLGVPLAFLGAHYFNLPVYWVVVLMYTEEVSKAIVGFMRFRSWKWMKVSKTELVSG